MHDQNSSVETMTQRQPVVHFGKQIAHDSGVFSLHLTLESVHFVHVFALVVTTGHEERVRVEELEAKEDKYALNREGAPVNEVSIEEVGILRTWKPVEFKDVHEVEELAVDVSTHRELGTIRDGNFH